MSTCQWCVGRKKKNSLLTCCAPSPLTIGEVRRGISLLIIEVVSSNGGCSAIIDGTLIHKITCREKLLRWLNYIFIISVKIILKTYLTLETTTTKEDYEIRHLKKACYHNNQQSHTPEDVFLSASTSLSYIERVLYTPSSGWTSEEDRSLPWS